MATAIKADTDIQFLCVDRKELKPHFRGKVYTGCHKYFPIEIRLNK